jgi:hypothetical protein
MSLARLRRDPGNSKRANSWLPSAVGSERVFDTPDFERRVAERRFRAAALDYGCTEITARSRVSAVMRRLRGRLEREQGSEKEVTNLVS